MMSKSKVENVNRVENLSKLIFSSSRLSRLPSFCISLAIFSIIFLPGLLILIPVSHFNGVAFGISVFLTVVFLIIGIVINIRCNIRRLHDANLSGWYVLFGFIPYLGVMWRIIYSFFFPSSNGKNRYGEPSPKPTKRQYAILLTPALIFIALAIYAANYFHANEFKSWHRYSNHYYSVKFPGKPKYAIQPSAINVHSMDYDGKDVYLSSDYLNTRSATKDAIKEQFNVNSLRQLFTISTDAIINGLFNPNFKKQFSPTILSNKVSHQNNTLCRDMLFSLHDKGRGLALHMKLILKDNTFYTIRGLYDVSSYHSKHQVEYYLKSFELAKGGFA